MVKPAAGDAIAVDFEIDPSAVDRFLAVVRANAAAVRGRAIVGYDLRGAG
ncbi:MAG: hypothetical protein ACT4P2_10880 [Pseudomonadota bacterium]